MLLFALAAAVGVVLFVTLGVVLLVVAAAAVLVLGAVGAVRLALLRRRLRRAGILLMPVQGYLRSRPRPGSRRPRDPDVIDVVPERD